jgi:hypothetical protein
MLLPANGFVCRSMGGSDLDVLQADRALEVSTCGLERHAHLCLPTTPSAAPYLEPGGLARTVHRMGRAVGGDVDRTGRVQDGRVKPSLDLHDIDNRGADIDRAAYHRVEKDVGNPVRIFVDFRWKGAARRR